MSPNIKKRMTAGWLLCLTLSTLLGLYFLPFLSQGPADYHSAGTLTYFQWAACQSGDPMPRMLPCPSNIAPNAALSPQLGPSKALGATQYWGQETSSTPGSGLNLSPDAIPSPGISPGSSPGTPNSSSPSPNGNLTGTLAGIPSSSMLIFKHLGFFPGILLALALVLGRALWASRPMGAVTTWLTVILGLTWLSFLVLGGRMFFPHSPLGSNLATIHPGFVLFLATALLFCVISFGEWYRLGHPGPPAGADKSAPAKKQPGHTRPSGPVHQ